MGKMRSRDGCLTCRRRHVKCDETWPVCNKCAKADRKCLQGNPSAELNIKRYRPRRSVGDDSSLDDDLEKGHQRYASGRTVQSPRSIVSVVPEPVTEAASYVSVLDTGLSPSLTTTVPTVLLATSPDPRDASVKSSEQTLHYVPPSDADVYGSPPVVSVEASPSRYEAYLLHHFVNVLSRWLDCTDASRQFTLNIVTLTRTCPVLLHAVTSFAARHNGDSDFADQAQQSCIELLIPLLSSADAAEDGAILCAIVILRVCEQLSATATGSDRERHLAGFSALLKTSQGRQVDPSIPTLSQAAFWVYVRQCLYNACVNQQPPNLDFDLIILPPPPANEESVNVKTETAWANTITWICATVIDYCFGASILIRDPLNKMRRWQELLDSVQTWYRTKPRTFEPLWHSMMPPSEASPFPEIWFSADWHIMAFGFYHLACMLLAIYKPSPRFAVGSSVRRTLPETERKVIGHARAFCGACQNSLKTVPSLITLCHSVFIWGPLITDSSERRCVISMLRYLEERHAWPTSWITKALEDEWRSSTFR